MDNVFEVGEENKLSRLFDQEDENGAKNEIENVLGKTFAIEDKKTLERRLYSSHKKSDFDYRRHTLFVEKSAKYGTHTYVVGYVSRC